MPKLMQQYCRFARLQAGALRNDSIAALIWEGVQKAAIGYFEHAV